MDWDDLRTFLAVARHGSLSAAARALGVTQPTMGRRLAAMESRTGARLLQRLPTGYALTPVGEAVLGNAERIEAEALAAERTITGRDITLEGVVRLTTVDTLAERIVGPALAALQRVQPGIVIELNSDSRSLSLSKREADIAIRMTRFEGNEVVSRKLGTLAIGIYAGKKYLTHKKDGETDKLITVLDDQAHLPEAKWLRAQFPDAQVIFSSNSREAQLFVAKTGGGIAALSRFRADEESDLVRIRPEQPDFLRDIWLGVHGDMRNQPRIRVVLDAVAKAFDAHKSVLCPSGT